MNRTLIRRVLGVFGIVAALMVGLFATGASAQMYRAGDDPSSNIQVNVVAQGSVPWRLTEGAGAAANQGGVTITGYEQCGFWVSNSQTAYYKHCGSRSSIQIRVRFNWGVWGQDRTIWVSRGNTNLSYHSQLQGNGVVTNAWCTAYCW